MYPRYFKIANHLDKIGKYKLADQLFKRIKTKTAQDFGWDLPAGAKNDSNVPYNQEDDTQWENSCDFVNAEIKPKIIKFVYVMLIEAYHEKENQKHNGLDDKKAADHVFQLHKKQMVEKYYNLNEYLKNLGSAGNYLMADINDILVNSLPTPMSPKEIFEHIKQVIEDNMDRIYKMEYEKNSNDVPDFD